MTTSEDWSLQFDLLYNNISSNQAPGLTEYEKSVFLTQAQEAVILDLYKGTLGDSFETTEEVTRYLSSLVKINYPDDDDVKVLQVTKEGMNMSAYILPEDVWFITYQSGRIKVGENTRDVIVVPSRQDSLYKDLNNPFKGPNKNKILAISEEGSIILYSKYPINTFYIKYLKRPNPIVLEDSELEINGISEFNVEIPESLHNQVLIRAVQMAKAVWQS
jgi:hypothetical protein